MSDWMDAAWQDFVNKNDLVQTAMPKADLLLLKEAWLHGAKASLARARTAVDDFMKNTRELA